MLDNYDTNLHLKHAEHLAGCCTVAVIKEVAARYKRAKLVGSPSQPPMLLPPTDEDETDGIKNALRELPPAEIASALSAHGIPTVVDIDENIDLLARALL